LNERVLFKREPGNNDLPLPSYQTPGSAGMDVRAAEDCILQPGETRLVATGFSMALPPGFEAQLRPRSGLALKHGITLLNSPGTVDSDFRAEVRVILTNLGHEPFAISRARPHRSNGDRALRTVYR
jgi:dUTP pyrophosphatase